MTVAYFHTHEAKDWWKLSSLFLLGRHCAEKQSVLMEHLPYAAAAGRCLHSRSLTFFCMPSAPWLSPLITVCSNLCAVMRETCFSPPVVTQSCLRVALYLLGTARGKCQLCLPFRMTFFTFACGMGVGEPLLHSVQPFWTQSSLTEEHKFIHSTNKQLFQMGMQRFVLWLN